MPIGRLIEERDAEYVRLLTALSDEWARPHPDRAEPVIIETTDPMRPAQTPTHLYVIWSDWRDLSQRLRSEMLLEAYTNVKGVNLARNVILALGLTPEEAKNVGLRYEISNAAA